MLLFNQLKGSSLLLTKPKILRLGLFIGLVVLTRGVFAEDALSAAEPVVRDTYNGSMKTYLYVGEGVAAVLALIFTRNIKTLGGIGAVAIFLNIVAALSGI